MEDETFPTTKKLFSNFLSNNNDDKNILYETNKKVKKLSLLVQEESFKSLEQFTRYNKELPLKIEEYISSKNNNKNRTSLCSKRHSRKSLNLMPTNKLTDSSKIKLSSISSLTSLSTNHYNPTSNKKHPFLSNVNSLSNLEILNLYKKYLNQFENTNERKSNYSPGPFILKTNLSVKPKDRDRPKVIYKRNTESSNTYYSSNKVKDKKVKEDDYFYSEGIEELKKVSDKIEKTRKRNNLFKTINNVYHYSKEKRSDKLTGFLEKLQIEEKTGKKIIKRNEFGYYDIFSDSNRTKKKNPFMFRRSRTMNDIKSKKRLNKEDYSKIKSKEPTLVNIINECKKTISKSEKKLHIELNKANRFKKKTNRIFYKEKFGKDIFFINTIKKDIKKEKRKYISQDNLNIH